MPPNEEQINLVHEVFASFSDDKNMTIPRNKIREVLSTIGITVTDNEVFDICTKMHIQKNDRITFKQFIDTLDQMVAKVESKDEFESAFDSFDRNNDGYITTHDLRVILYDFGVSFSEHDLDRLMRATGSKETDVRVNQEQFLVFMKQVMSGELTDAKVNNLSSGIEEFSKEASSKSSTGTISFLEGNISSKIDATKSATASRENITSNKKENANKDESQS